MMVSTCPELVGASYSSTGNILEELSPLLFLNADGFTEFKRAAKTSWCVINVFV